MEIQFSEGDARWEALRLRCRTDLWWLAGVVLGLGGPDALGMTERAHRFFLSFLERKTGIPEIDAAPYRRVMMPRGFGKTVLDNAWALQKVLQNPNISILIANEKLDLASDMLSTIKTWMLQNELLQRLFPDILPKSDKDAELWAADRIKLKRETARRDPTIFCIGTGGIVTGAHPDIIICDDILSREAAENARSGIADITGRINRWVAQLVPLLNQGAQPYPEIVFIGTRWFAGDSYEYIEQAFGYGQPKRTWQVIQKMSDGETQAITVSRVGDLAMFQRQALEHGRAIWRERPGYDEDSLAKLRMTDPLLFAANYQNDPNDPSTATFKEDWIRYYDWLDQDTVLYQAGDGGKKVAQLQDLDVIMLVDPGGFKQARRTDDRARGAIVVTASDADGRHLLLETWSEPATFLQVAGQIVALCTRYKPRRLGIENAGQQAAFIQVVKDLFTKTALQAPPMQDLLPKSKDKDQRILGLEGYFQRGQVYLAKSARSAEFREQYRTWPRGRRRDLLDALAYGPSVWRSTGVNLSQRERQQREIAMVRAKMSGTFVRT